MAVARSVLALFAHVLGERVACPASEAIRRTLRESVPCAVLINDIGFSSRLEIYLRHGMAGVVSDYVHRKTCAERDLRVCQLGQIPAVDDIPLALDSQVYELADRLLRKVDFDLYGELLRGGLSPDSRRKYVAFMRELIVPTLVAEYIESHWKHEPIVYSERRQRNRSMGRLRCREGSYNWCEVRKALRADPLNAFILEELDPGVLQGKSGAPRCRAILLALFEDISLSHGNLLVRTSSRLRMAWEEAQGVYLKVAGGLPEDTPYRLRWSLSFRNEFWEED